MICPKMTLASSLSSVGQSHHAGCFYIPRSAALPISRLQASLHTDRQHQERHTKLCTTLCTSTALDKLFLPSKLWPARRPDAGLRGTSIQARSSTEHDAVPNSRSLRLLGLSSGKTGVLLLNVLSAIYGATAVAIKLQDGGSADDSAAGTCLMFCMRSLVALVSFLPLLKLQRPASSRGRKASRGLLLGGVETGLWMFLEEAGQALGLETSTAGHAALLLTFSVVLVPFLEFFAGKPITKPVWGATLLAAFGMMLLEEGPAMFHSLSSSVEAIGAGGAVCHFPLGDLLCLASSLGFAMYVVRSEHHCAKENPLDLAFVQLATVAVASVLWEAWAVFQSGIGGAALWQHVQGLPWPIVLFIGALGTGVAQWIELESLCSVTSTAATLIFTTTPLWSTAIAYFMLGEAVDVWSALGGGLILFASVAAQLWGAPKDAAKSVVMLLPPVVAAPDLTALFDCEKEEFNPSKGTAPQLVPVRVLPSSSIRRQESRVLSTRRAFGITLLSRRARRRQ